MPYCLKISYFVQQVQGDNYKVEAEILKEKICRLSQQTNELSP